jgi:putative addiction module component (TIGR02574 family)
LITFPQVSITQLKELALALPPEERADLAEILWESVLPEFPPGADEGDLVAELRRRDEEMSNGSVPCYTHEEVMAHARRIAGC